MVRGCVPPLNTFPSFSLPGGWTRCVPYVSVFGGTYVCIVEGFEWRADLNYVDSSSPFPGVEPVWLYSNSNPTPHSPIKPFVTPIPPLPLASITSTSAPKPKPNPPRKTESLRSTVVFLITHHWLLHPMTRSGTSRRFHALDVEVGCIVLGLLLRFERWPSRGQRGAVAFGDLFSGSTNVSANRTKNMTLAARLALEKNQCRGSSAVSGIGNSAL